jgi:hypothetical protein
MTRPDLFVVAEQVTIGSLTVQVLPVAGSADRIEVAGVVVWERAGS